MRAPSRGFRIALARRGAAHRLDELVVGGLLEHVAERARAQRLARERRLLLHRQDDDLGVGRLLADHGDRLEARAAGHVQVEHEHRGVVAAHIAPGALDVARLGDDLEVRLAVEQQPQAAAHDRVIVGEHDPDRLWRASLGLWRGLLRLAVRAAHRGESIVFSRRSPPNRPLIRGCRDRHAKLCSVPIRSAGFSRMFGPNLRDQHVRPSGHRTEFVGSGRRAIVSHAQPLYGSNRPLLRGRWRRRSTSGARITERRIEGTRRSFYTRRTPLGCSSPGIAPTRSRSPSRWASWTTARSRAATTPVARRFASTRPSPPASTSACARSCRARQAFALLATSAAGAVEYAVEMCSFSEERHVRRPDRGACPHAART